MASSSPNQKAWVRWVAIVAVAGLVLLTVAALVGSATDQTAAPATAASTL